MCLLLFCQCDHLLELKSSPNAFKICPNCSQSSFHKFIFLQNSPKSRHSFWATIVSKFISKTFKKSPNLVTLILPYNCNTKDFGYFAAPNVASEVKFSSPERRFIAVT